MHNLRKFLLRNAISPCFLNSLFRVNFKLRRKLLNRDFKIFINPNFLQSYDVKIVNLRIEEVIFISIHDCFFKSSILNI